MLANELDKFTSAMENLEYDQKLIHNFILTSIDLDHRNQQLLIFLHYGE